MKYEKNNNNKKGKKFLYERKPGRWADVRGRSILIGLHHSAPEKERERAKVESTS